ncbi:MAG: DUF5110 domain-containing protein [Deltaproteobacteria bacterium]|jgi:alpha-glucosidase|nr:DUF5110 domain-containing protein [Deltaproteobacteria bacterium]
MIFKYLTHRSSPKTSSPPSASGLQGLGRIFASILLAGLINLAGPVTAEAAPTVTQLGPYFLSYEQVRKGLWHFVLSQSAPGSPGQKLPNTIMLTPSSQWVSAGDVPESRVSLTTQSGRPYISVNLTDQPSAGSVFVISPYSPDGLLSGLMIFGDQYTHLTGLGADFKVFTTGGLNLIGQVIQPGGPYGNRVNKQAEGQTSGLQAPVLFALGAGRVSGALFFNETRPLVWDLSARPWTVGILGPDAHNSSLDFFVIIGEDLPSIRRTYSSVIGRPPVPPRSIFSPWVVDDIRPGQQPWSDYFSKLKDFFRPFDITGLLLWNQPENLPLAEAKAAGLELMVSESPYIEVNNPNFSDMDKRGFLVKSSEENGRSLMLNYNGKSSGLIDYTDPAAASYWHSIFRSKLIDAGANTFFLLGGEPESYSNLAWYKGVGGQGEHSHFAWANRFSLKWMEGFGIGLRNQRFRPGLGFTRTFLLARAGLAGQGRYGAGLYSVEPFFFSPVPQGQARANLNLSGIDYFSTDIFPLLEQFPVERYNSNFAAWMAKNALLNIPLLVPQNFLNEPWTAPNLTLKARLEPYYYSLAHQANLTGDPVMSPLLYYFQEDLLAREAAFEVMVGPYILVAAGVTPGAEVLSFHLPAGKWYDFLGKEVITQETAGPRVLPCKQNGIPMSPVLLRAGAIVPNKSDNPAMSDRLHVTAFPGEDVSFFDFYEDNGQNINYLSGEKLRTRLEMTPEAGLLTMTVQAQAGQMPGAAKTRGFLLEFVGLGNVGTITLDGESFRRLSAEADLNEIDSGWFSAGTGRLVFKTPILDLTKDHALVLR